jgi:guanylate kinase
MSSNAVNKGKLLIFSAPSGSGKTTLVKYLMANIENVCFSVSATSRLPRVGEVEGKEYYFISSEMFRQKIENNEFLEWEEVYENIFYGTLVSEVEHLRSKGYAVLFDVDVVGGLNIKKYYGNEALAVFVEVPSIEVLEKRLLKRSSDSPESIQERLKKAKWEMSFAKDFDIIIVNDVLEEAEQETLALVTNFLNETTT